MSSEFCNRIRLSGNELTHLKGVVKACHPAHWIFRSLDGLYASQTATLCGIYDSDKLASFAWHMPRSWMIDGVSFTGLSIGIVTTAPGYRNKGYAKHLISRIEEIARQGNIDFLYLAGIPNFYGKYGFKGYAPKSKLVFNKADLPKTENCLIRPASLEDLRTITSMHGAYSKQISSFSSRSSREWEDLLGPLSSTFLFNNPRMILDRDLRPIAYFCSTPGDCLTIREFVPLLDSASVISALSSIAYSVEHRASDVIEIFSPASGQIWEAAKDRIGADFLCFLRPHSSNMIKWISTAKSFDSFRCKFILQGDIL